MKFTSSLKLKLIYVFRINDEAHKNCLKIGEATCDSDDLSGLSPNCKALNESAKKRINQYTQTAGISYELLYTELTIYNSKNGLCSFNDKEVHNVLERSGIKKKVFDTVNKANEWFITDLETVKKAIAAVKEGRNSLTANEVTQDKSPIVFRPEQKEAIEKTKRQFKKNNQMLWNAKMRFGKTLTALQVVKEMDFCRTLILTHRPVVDGGWFEDFGKIFYDRNYFAYGSKNNGEKYSILEKQAKEKKGKYVYFASMQDLRGSELVGGNFDKNNEIFSTKWDLLIVDEAHEGTQTELGKNVLAELIKSDTKVLRLSGTPFNLLDDFKEDEIYTWDYVMEQREKAIWDKIHLGDHNPYECMPAMNIYTYDLGRLLHEFIDEDVAFNFREFFRTNENGKFIHEKDVQSFLNLISKEDKDSCYPYSCDEYRNNFRHSLWMVPGVKEARALSAILQTHPVFQHFKIVNVAGDGDEDEERSDALEAVKKAIGENPEETRTITLSCGRLTTGVSVGAWTAVFMLSGSYNTAASGYMQTIFRVQTPAVINGRVKKECYVFDFAPDRTLKVIAETAKVSAKAGKTGENDRKAMGEFLNFCPIIAVDGSKMTPFDTPRMLEQLKRVYVERVVRNGFEDKCLYNDDLMKLNDLELQEFDDLKKIIGQTKAMPKTNHVDINNQGLTDEQYEELETLEKKAKKKGGDKSTLSEDELHRLEKLKEKKKNREAAISILRGISIRMPLLIYGAELNDETEEITIENFASKIDNQSWEEFMPKGVTKEKFNSIKKYYDADIFCAAGKRIRSMTRAADKLSIEERIERITNIFANFRNPDKETVLTPWRVVNMHLGDCLGGYNFFEKGYDVSLQEPRYIDRGKVTQEVFAEDARILEINSKSGLYPLYMAYSIYRTQVAGMLTSTTSIEEQHKIWDKVIAENIFVICKTPMAKSITKRTLIGFRNAKINAHYFDDLINQIKNKPEGFVEKVSKGSYWKINDKNMKFNAVVGNPPYQVNDGSGASDDAANPIYHIFARIAIKISPKYISLIMPSKWMIGGKVILKSFRKEMMKDERISTLYDYENSGVCFNGQHIDGGIMYYLWDRNHLGKLNYVFIPENGEWFISKRLLSDGNTDIVVRDNRRQSIISKTSQAKYSFKKIVSLTQPYGIRKDLFNSPERYPLSKLSDEPFDGCIKIFGVKGIKGGARRTVGYISPSIISKNTESIKKYKLFFTTSYSTNAFNPPDTILGEPNSACTETFLLIGPFNSEEEQQNCHKYINSNFFKTLLFFGRGTMQVSQDVFRFIPLQDFTNHSNIDWSRTIAEIDKQLFSKYGLTKEEITFIEKMIKPK